MSFLEEYEQGNIWWFTEGDRYLIDTREIPRGITLTQLEDELKKDDEIEWCNKSTIFPLVKLGNCEKMLRIYDVLVNGKIGKMVSHPSGDYWSPTMFKVDGCNNKKFWVTEMKEGGEEHCFDIEKLNDFHFCGNTQDILCEHQQRNHEYAKKIINKLIKTA